MLPKTTQATSTEVEGETTVEVQGTDANGTPLEELQKAETLEQTADSPAEEAKPEGETQEVGSDTELSEKPPRTERRTEKLIDALKSRTDEVSELRKRLEQFQAPVQPEQSNLPPWVQPQPLADEVTPEEYQHYVLSTAHDLVKAETAAIKNDVLQYQAFKDDLAYVENKYPVLNSESEAYKKEFSDKVGKYFDKASKADPTLRLKDFVDDWMAFHQAGQEIGKKELKTSVIKREAEAAVNPSQTGDLPNKSDSDWDSMTLKEKEEWMKSNGIWDK